MPCIFLGDRASTYISTYYVHMQEMNAAKIWTARKIVMQMLPIPVIIPQLTTFANEYYKYKNQRQLCHSYRTREDEAEGDFENI